MKPRHFLAIIIIPLGLIMAAIPQNTTHPYKLTPAELLEHVNSGMQYFTPDEVAHMVRDVAAMQSLATPIAWVDDFFEILKFASFRKLHRALRPDSKEGFSVLIVFRNSSVTSVILPSEVLVIISCPISGLLISITEKNYNYKCQG